MQGDVDFQKGVIWKDKFDQTVVVIVKVQYATLEDTIHYNRTGMNDTQKLPKELFLKRYARY